MTTTSTESYSEQIRRLKNEIENADAIVIGAGAGMSASAGFTYSGERFEKYFADFRKRYGFTDMYTGCLLYTSLADCRPAFDPWTVAFFPYGSEVW